MKRESQSRGFSFSLTLADFLYRAVRAPVGADELQRQNEYLDDLAVEHSSLVAENERLKDEVRELKADLSAERRDRRLVSSDLALGEGELYDGEMHDRVLGIIRGILDRGSTQHARDVVALNASVSQWRPTGHAPDFLDYLAQARKNDRTVDVFTQVFQRIGYRVRSDGGHCVFSPPKDSGMESVTIGVTPSDRRAGKNAVSRARAVLGLSILGDIDGG